MIPSKPSRLVHNAPIPDPSLTLLPDLAYPFERLPSL